MLKLQDKFFKSVLKGGLMTDDEFGLLIISRLTDSQKCQVLKHFEVLSDNYLPSYFLTIETLDLPLG